MASDGLKEIWEGYKSYYRSKGADVTLVDACCKASAHAVLTDGDLDYAFGITKQSKEWIKEFIAKETGADFDALEVWSQENKKPVDIINQYYSILLLEAPYLFESFCFYVEKNRPKRERFYEPRVNPLRRVVEKLQALEDDELDELFVHMPPRVGKTQLETLFMAWHCARNTEPSNLYVTYKEGLGGAFLDGVQEIITDPTYCFADVFPKVKITETDAKNNKMDLGTDRRRKKKYKSLSGKGLEAGLNGEYDAHSLLLIDDPLEGVQDVMSEEVLKRKQTIFDNNVISRAKEKCKVLNNGTIWATNDLFMNRLKFLEEAPEAQNIRYEIIKIPALDPVTDESNFNYKYGVGFSTEYYRARRAKFEMNDDLAGWWAQYQQEPIDRKGAVFNPEHMKYFAVLPEENPLKKIAHCDTALGGGDFVSFPIIYCYEDGRWYCDDVVFDNSEKHITEPQVVSAIKRHYLKNVHFESNQGGEGYKDDIAKALSEDKEFNNGKPINITSSWAPTDKRKEQRIWDNAEAIRQIYFKDPQHRHKQYQMFMNNLFSFTMVHSKRQHDDAADSLAATIEFDANGSGVKTAKIIRSPI